MYLWKICDEQDRKSSRFSLKIGSKAEQNKSFVSDRKNHAKKKQEFVLFECLRTEKLHIVKKLCGICKKEA